MTSVIIHDYENARRTRIVFDDADFLEIKNHWFETDRILIDLQKVLYFKGRLCWNDLGPNHFRIMIEQNLAKVGSVLDQDVVDGIDPVVVSLNFLICALIHCMQTKCESIIDLVRITRINATETAFEFTSTLNFPVAPKNSNFRVVVDNS